jgi:hypothetical protein
MINSQNNFKTFIKSKGFVEYGGSQGKGSGTLKALDLFVKDLKIVLALSILSPPPLLFLPRKRLSLLGEFTQRCIMHMVGFHLTFPCVY